MCNKKIFSNVNLILISNLFGEIPETSRYTIYVKKKKSERSWLMKSVCYLNW